MTTILVFYLLMVSFLLQISATKTKYITKVTVLYETVYPVETIHVTDETQCSSLGLSMCHGLIWVPSSPSSSPPGPLSSTPSSSGFSSLTRLLSSPATSLAAFLLSDTLSTATSNVFHNATTAKITVTKAGATREPNPLDSASFNTKLNAVNTENTAPDIWTKAITPTTTITITESLNLENGFGPSSVFALAPNSDPETTVTRDHHSPFMLEGPGSGHFVQYGPEGSIILGPVIPNRARSAPPMFILHHHGYLASRHDVDDIVFLRLIVPSKTRGKRDDSSIYYKAIHGPKNNISFDDLTSRFSLTEGFLNFFEEGQNSSRFDWYVATDGDYISRLVMAPTEATIPKGFSQVVISKQNINRSSTGDLPTSTVSTTSRLPGTTAPISASTTPPQFSATNLSGANPDITVTSFRNTPVSGSVVLRPGSYSSTISIECPKTPDPARVWNIIQTIARLDLRGYCSNLLGYDLATILKTKPGPTRSVTVNITNIDETETETETYYTNTATVAFSTIYNAGDGAEPSKRHMGVMEDDITPDITYPVIEKSSYDGVYGTGEEIATQVNTLPNIDSTPDSLHKTPQQLASFCEIDISEACSQIITSPVPITITKTKKIKTVTIPVTEVPTKTETKVLLAASTTTLLNTTQISYPGTGLLVVDSGMYHQWYLYWTGEVFDPALYLRLPSVNATLFTAEYRPSMDTYRIYTNAPDGERYYMSIATVIGISAITDYSISLKTLDDINSDEGSVLLYIDLSWENGFISVNKEATGTDRSMMFGCAMVMGLELRAQVRLYSAEDGTVPRVCEAWSNLILTS
ncbi:hypothetical protein TWF730_007530 [Orbilia blumenaviensis]|uniref:Uncharacterized protein n=1 Tax=Orbilia blumenaviensis TaxID=1796055 RepID=A0AAV9VBW0_9PEZI